MSFFLRGIGEVICFSISLSSCKTGILSLNCLSAQLKGAFESETPFLSSLEENGKKDFLKQFILVPR